jgi:hypothetical protein
LGRQYVFLFFLNSSLVNSLSPYSSQQADQEELSHQFVHPRYLPVLWCYVDVASPPQRYRCDLGIASMLAVIMAVQQQLRRWR